VPVNSFIGNVSFELTGTRAVKIIQRCKKPKICYFLCIVTIMLLFYEKNTIKIQDHNFLGVLYARFRRFLIPLRIIYMINQLLEYNTSENINNMRKMDIKKEQH
jgi:hypothetical protein